MTSFSATTIEPFYVVDTHALIWYLRADKQLSLRAAAIFEAAKRGETQLLVSAVAIAEMYYVNRKHGFFDDFSKTYRELKNQPYFQIVDFHADDVLEFERDAVVTEMHDRIIAGLARWLGVPLLTHDSVITASGLVTVIW